MTKKKKKKKEAIGKKIMKVQQTQDEKKIVIRVDRADK
jgi:hypothetical protein